MRSGKWHLGMASLSYMPWRRGFTSATGFLMGSVDYHTKCSVGSKRNGAFNASERLDMIGGYCRSSTAASRLYDWFDTDQRLVTPATPYLSPGHPRYNRTYQTSLHAERARRIIMEHDAASPLFLYLAFQAVHSPLQASPDLLARVEALRAAEGGTRVRDTDAASYWDACSWFDWGGGVPPLPYVPEEEEQRQARPDHWCNGAARRVLEAMALGVDDAVGIIVRALEARGFWSQSLLIFASDNGGAFAQQQSNKPQRGGKGGTLEGGLRTVAALGGGWLPPRLRGRVSHQLTHVADWWPTLSAAAAIPTYASDTGRGVRAGQAPPVDGLSMWGAWTAEASPGPGQGRSVLERVVLIDASVALMAVRRSTGSDGAGRAAIYKLSTAPMLQCPEGHVPSCAPQPPGARPGVEAVPPSTATTTEDGTGARRGEAHLDAHLGWGESCTLAAPCLFDVSVDDGERVLLESAAHAPLVDALIAQLNASRVPATDPFYPTTIACPDLPMYAANGHVRQPSEAWTLPPYLPLPPTPPPAPPRFPTPPRASTPQPDPRPCATPSELASECEMDGESGTLCSCRYKWGRAEGRWCPLEVRLHCK